MLSRRVVEHFDIVEHILPGFGSGPVGLAPYPLSLQQVEEALRDSIVMTVSASAHRGRWNNLKERCPVREVLRLRFRRNFCEMGQHAIYSLHPVVRIGPIADSNKRLVGSDAH
jgi:hypothetical protein